MARTPSPWFTEERRVVRQPEQPTSRSSARTPKGSRPEEAQGKVERPTTDPPGVPRPDGETRLRKSPSPKPPPLLSGPTVAEIFDTSFSTGVEAPCRPNLRMVLTTSRASSISLPDGRTLPVDRVAGPFTSSSGPTATTTGAPPTNAGPSSQCSGRSTGPRSWATSTPVRSRRSRSRSLLGAKITMSPADFAALALSTRSRRATRSATWSCSPGTRGCRPQEARRIEPRHVHLARRVHRHPQGGGQGQT